MHIKSYIHILILWIDFLTEFDRISKHFLIVNRLFTTCHYLGKLWLACTVYNVLDLDPPKKTSLAHLLVPGCETRLSFNTNLVLFSLKYLLVSHNTTQAQLLLIKLIQFTLLCRSYNLFFPSIPFPVTFS